MRPCPNCGEPIDDGVDVCRNCGTVRDASIPDNARAQPPDPRGSDGGRREDPEDAAPGAAMPDGRDRGRIVELCSTANVFEAFALHNELEQEGIRSRVAGESLQDAAGALPLGQITAPRVWVWEEDLPRAREIADAWVRRAGREGRISDEQDEPSEPDHEPDEGTASPASDSRSTGPGCVWAIAGLACITIGAIEALAGPLPSPWDAPAWAVGIGASLLLASCLRRWKRQAARV